MKQQEAEKLLNETFNNQFSLENYINFLNELLKGKLNRNNGKEFGVNKEFEEYIKSFKKIGEYKNGRNNVEVFAVELRRVSSLERARTMQRNFVAKWLHNEFLPKDAALVAFYGENPEDWRFSFVKMEYKLGEDGKVLKELTPAKRYSFLVGKNEPNHTCKRQFLKLLTEEDIPPTLEELERSFSVENVTKEFFEEYKNRFFELRESIEKILDKNSIVKKEFENKNINPTEFAKKLLGQIVFLYFLQKKGWLGVKKDNDGKFNEWGTGPRDFMKKLFGRNIVDYDNFFNDVLEPLFYQALANDRSADNDYYEKLKCKVPFLNGGLFEPIKDYDWTKTDILIDNNIFKDIFSTFDQFNFTIKEDEPLEREVAVDPEMLGKVFENLLDVQDRKSKGAFYTPREIVHYMCQQSLINYLETNTTSLGIKREDIELFILKGDIALDRLRRANIGRASAEDIKLVLPKSISSNFKELDRLLREIKICDPAVGSGAFPVGMMNEIVRARNILSYFFLPSEIAERTDYNLKRQTIENSLYGVDIESSAVEITKLRFWLSLIVDELDMKNIRPLPNLDNRIMCGNSLIEEFEGVKLFDEDLANGKTSKQMTLFKKGSEYKLETLQNLQSTYFNEQDRNKKKKLMKDIENLEWEFIEATLKEQNNEEALKKLEQYRNSKSKPFFLWKLYFSDVFRRDNPGFDVIIANPPYVGEKGHKEIFRPIAQTEFGKRFYQGKMDLFYFFFHKAIDMAREKAQIAFITTNYYSTALGAKNLRKDFKERTIIRKLINFNELKIFESALGQHNMITLISKEVNLSFIADMCLTHKEGTADSNMLYDILYDSDKETDYYKVPQKDLYDGEENYIRLGGNSENSKNPIVRLLGKIKSKGLFLGSICEINNGVHTEADYLSKKKFLYRDDKSAEIGDGIYVLDSTNKKDAEVIKNILGDKSERNYLKPFFKNSDVKKYYSNTKTNKYLIYINKQKDNIKELPLIKQQLSRFKKILDMSSDNSPYLHRPKKENIFLDEKIIVPQRSKENTFGYNKSPWFSSADVYFINKKDPKFSIKYLLALLNSKIIYFWLYHRGKRKGETLELYNIPLSEIPIMEISIEKQKPFIEIVDRILSITDDEDYLKNADKQAMIKAYEKKIDKIIYDIYEITPEEIKIIEGFKK